MSVIIRLQNLPWSANALDIRQFFKGLSIPEGGVHIVGGEMGDAFIAFSTDEDARQAMMHDREKINEVQVRLLLSSRAEMQKVIETARQQSMLALQNVQKTTGLATSVTAPHTTTPQPPIITTSSLQTILSNSIGAAPSFLTYQQQAGITLGEKKIEMVENGKSSVVQRIVGELCRERRRSKSGSRERRRSRSRERNPRRRRSRDRSRSREKKVRYPSRRSRSKDRERERDRSQEHIRNSARSASQNTEKEPYLSSNHNTNKSDISIDPDENDNGKSCLPAISSWSIPPMNAYKTNYSIGLPSSSHNELPSTSSFIGVHNSTHNAINAYTTGTSKPGADSIKFTTSTTNASIIIPAFQSYTSTANNYSINLLGNSNSNSSDSIKAFTLKNPYTTAIQAANVISNSQDTNSLLTVQKQTTTMFPGLLLEGKSEETSSDKISNPIQGDQEPIAFANTNPYEQIYPGLFAQAAALSSATKSSFQNQNLVKENLSFEKFPDSCCIKIANMCGSTTYSDLRKFFSGLFIPHNGIKMVNDIHGLRAGIAYIQFSRVSNVQKALNRNNTLLKGKAIQIEVVSENEFETIEDSFRPQSRFDKGDRSHYGGRNDSDSWTEGNNGDDTISKEKSLTKNQEKQESLTVLYIEDIPALTTEQDIMKMFSSYTIYDILLTSSPENRREFIAHVKFSRPSEAKCALEDKSRHLIGYRKVRVRPGREANMEKAKEKLRLANEQLLKEEQSILEINLKQNETEKDSHLNRSDQINYDTSNNNTGGSRTSIQCNLLNPFSQNSLSVDSKNISIPSIFDLNAPRPDSLEKSKASDPRLIVTKSKDESTLKIEPPINYNTYNSFAPDLIYQSNKMENNFIILKNCEYNIRINDLAEMFLSSNLKLKHIEQLRNDRQIPSGEFIVEFQNSQDAEKAINNFNNIRLHSRNIKLHHISPQEIADRLQKPFLNYMPNANGCQSQSFPKTFDYQSKPNENDIRSNENLGYRSGSSVPSTRGMRGFSGNNSSASRMRDMLHKGRCYHNMNDNRDNPDISDIEKPNQVYDISNTDNGNRMQDMVVKSFNTESRTNDYSANAEGEDGIPEKFTRPGCVLTMENVPFKADLKDILSFFHEFHLLPDDIIRRFNDDGSPTGDARVAFETPAIARAAFEAKRRKHIFNRTIYISIL